MEKRLKGELSKSESGRWAIWYWKEDRNSFEGGKYPVHPEIQEKMEQFEFMDYLSDGIEVEFVIVKDDKVCEEFGTNEYAKIVQPEEEEISEFKKIRESIIRQLKNVIYDNGDVSDVGNEIGIAIAKHLNENQNVEDFMHGVRHGVSLIDGSHSSDFEPVVSDDFTIGPNGAYEYQDWDQVFESYLGAQDLHSFLEWLKQNYDSPVIK